jgi:hypothetical protein
MLEAVVERYMFPFLFSFCHVYYFIIFYHFSMFQRKPSFFHFLFLCERTERRAPALPGKVDKRCKMRIRPLRGAPKRKQGPFLLSRRAAAVAVPAAGL